MKKTILYREGNPYLIRYTLFKCKWFTIKIHKALMSDPADLHDHPWDYISLILWGGYYEATEEVYPMYDPFECKQCNVALPTQKWYGPLSLLIRKGNIPHKLILPKDSFSISLIITSSKWRDWGFKKDNMFALV